MRVKLGGVNVNGNFEVLPAGTYTVQLTDYGMKSAASGNEYMSCEFEIMDGEFVGRKIWDNIVFVDTALWKLKSFAIATGFGNVDDAEGIETDDVFQNAMGATIKVKVIVEKSEYKGKMQERNKIESYIFDSPTTPNVVGDDDVPF